MTPSAFEPQDPQDPEEFLEHVVAREFEAIVRPRALKFTGQYEKGLITLQELIVKLDELYNNDNQNQNQNPEGS